MNYLEVSFNEETGVNSRIIECNYYKINNIFIIECKSDTFRIEMYDSILLLTNSFGIHQFDQSNTMQYLCEGVLYNIKRYKSKSSVFDGENVLYFTPTLGLVAYYNQGWIFNMEIVYDSEGLCGQSILSLIKNDLDFHYEYYNWPPPPELE